MIKTDTLYCRVVQFENIWLSQKWSVFPVYSLKFCPGMPSNK
jgi:hypothetical protein